MSRPYGIARLSLVEWLMTYPYDSDWDKKHSKIAESHKDEKGHEVCGCEIHQAYCPLCDVGFIDGPGTAPAS